jgi:DNA ligase D-like protein (predicted 3'-phosphoesterase)
MKNNERKKIDTYNQKRDFSKTPEPEGKKESSSGPLTFVIQKHAASRLHYDLRLEINGVMPSWAIPKGPSTDYNVKRLAMQTEDHPMSYADFEGIIPEGYGAGSVMVWDNGTYDNLRLDKDGNPIPIEECLAEGKIEAYFHGHKTKGAYVLFRLKNAKERNAWIFKKIKDSGAIQDYDITEEKPKSVLTKRTLEEIAKDKGGLNKK